jgi:hypothetical protein
MSRWIEDIEHAHPDEQEEMSRQPSGWAVVWAFGVIAFWVLAIACFFLLR